MDEPHRMASEKFAIVRAKMDLAMEDIRRRHAEAMREYLALSPEDQRFAELLAWQRLVAQSFDGNPGLE